MKIEKKGGRNEGNGLLCKFWKAAFCIVGVFEYVQKKWGGGHSQSTVLNILARPPPSSDLGVHVPGADEHVQLSLRQAGVQLLGREQERAARLVHQVPPATDGESGQHKVGHQQLTDMSEMNESNKE